MASEFQVSMGSGPVPRNCVTAKFKTQLLKPTASFITMRSQLLRGEYRNHSRQTMPLERRAKTNSVDS